MTATDTSKRGLIRTVPFIDGAAPVTRLRCIPRINQHHGNAAHLRFIRDVLSKLEERPIAVFGALGFPNRLLGALAHMGQLFHGKRTPSAFFRNQLLGNGVVGLCATFEFSQPVVQSIAFFCRQVNISIAQKLLVV